MPILDYDYSSKDYQLVANQTTGSFGEGNNESQYDYIRLVVYQDTGTGLGVGSDNTIATVTQNEGQIGQAIFYSSLGEEVFEINTSPFYKLSSELVTKQIGGVINGESTYNDFKIYKSSPTSENPNGNIYVKPNEIFNTFGLPQGNYKLQIDFLNQVKPAQDSTATVSSGHYQFLIKEISPSRKEVRLKLVDYNLDNNNGILDRLRNNFNTDNLGVEQDKYQYRHLLNLASGNNIPITNYTFDGVTDGVDNQSIILRLYEPIPTNIGAYNQVTIEREVLITQVTDVYYFSDVGAQFEGTGLIPDEAENWIIPNQNESLDLENYNDLTASLSNASLANLVSGSDYNYPNLNTDFRLFENHTFFGSAKRKLQNFKSKVETIQGHYSDISSSLSASGTAVSGDSNELIEYRKNLFNKIENEINKFTPYERFLYYDGQSDSTASAPGVGQTYTNTIPVSTQNYIGQINGGEGLDDTIYHHSNKNSGIIPDIELFSNQYKVQNAPFFNYSSSIYLSFLMKGDDGVSLSWQNSNRDNTVLTNGTEPPFPNDALYQNEISNPTITGSHYHRVILEASQSYWVPTSNANFDFSEIRCFTDDSPEIEILSGSVKTGSSAVKDTSGVYQNYTTVVTQSGVPFIGACMPAGELFRIFTENTLSSSLLGYYDYQGVTIDDGDFEVFDKSGNSNTLIFAGAGGVSHTSASITTGVDGGDAFAITFSGSLEGKSGSLFLTTNGSTAPIETTAGQISMSAAVGDDVTGFTMATYYKSTSTKTNTTIMSMDIKSGSTDVDGWHILRKGDALSGEVTRGGINILDDDTSEDGLLTGTLTPRDGNFHHIAMTYDNLTGTGSIFFDGVLQKQGNSRGFITGSNKIFRLIVGTGAGSAQGFADATFDESRFYTRALTPSEINQLYLNPDGITETKITDVKITLKDPTNTQPFSELYHTSSAEWTSWYDGMYDSASAFDTDNIHSLENNLPTYIQNSNEYDELKDFLSLQGEQYDIVRNHIDSLGTIYDRGYKKTDSPPENTYPLLLSGLGWEAINPFSGSLSETLGSYLNGITSIDDIKNNTWRKTLNNLLYVYKTKGTENSLRALMNIYGYPPDVLKLREFGGSNQDVVDNGIISDEPPAELETQIDTDLLKQTGSIGFIKERKNLYNYIFQGRKERGIKLDWWMNKADTNSIEFVYKHNTTTQTQTLFKSSGSGAEHLWDLRLVPSTDGISSSFEFRLNNSNTGSSAIADNAVSMSTAFSNMTDGQLWNVKLQRMTSSVSGSGTNEYRLHTSLQNESSIQTYNYVTMSISGGLSNTYVTGGADSNYYANQNFQSSGSRHYLSSSNLFVGETFSGSMAEIKAWTTALSMSKFRKHTLNKFSTLGNSIMSHCNELIYHFKLNENYTTASISSSTQTLHIIDSSPKDNLTTDYSFLIERLDEITGSCASRLYGVDIIDTIKLGLQDNNQDNINDNSIIINPSTHIIGDLNAESTIFGFKGKRDFVTSPKLELNNSPQDIVNNHILNHMDSFNFEKYYGNPQYYFSASYKELDDLREEFFDCSPILVNTNQYIRAQENILNRSVTDAIKTAAPARSTLSDANTTIGVTIKPTLLERQKYEQEEYSVETNPNSPSGSLSLVSTGSYQHNFVLSSLLELPHSSSISLGSAYVSESVDGRFTTPQFLQPGGYTASLESEKTGLISPLPEFTGSLELPYSSSLSMGSTFISESGDNRTIVPPFIQQGGVTASIEFPKSGSIEEITTQYTKEFVNIHDSWGTHETSSHFMNYANKVGNTYNNSALDMRFANSASAGSTVSLTSIEAEDYVNTGSTSPNLQELTFKTKTYLFVSHSGTANLDYNGALSTDSSSVHVLTGSNSSTLGISGSQAGNLLAAITSSNGHGESFKMNQVILGIDSLNHVVNLINRVNGPVGNTLSASFNTSMELSLIDGTASPLPFRGGSIGLGEYDDGHIETRYNFKTIGDTEYYSGSFNNSDNFSCAGNFYNREQITKNLHKEIQYESFLTGNPGLQDGRMMGKTRYFFTSSDNNITLPSNHIDKFSTPFKDRMYEGAKNTSPGFLDTQYEDYATASFYRVKVTGGETQISVRQPNPKIDSDDKIIY